MVYWLVARLLTWVISCCFCLLVGAGCCNSFGGCVSCLLWVLGTLVGFVLHGLDLCYLCGFLWVLYYLLVCDLKFVLWTGLFLTAVWLWLACFSGGCVGTSGWIILIWCNFEFMLFTFILWWLIFFFDVLVF